MKNLGHDSGKTPGHAQVRTVTERERQEERVLAELAAWPRCNDGQTLRIPRESR